MPINGFLWLADRNYFVGDHEKGGNGDFES